MARFAMRPVLLSLAALALALCLTVTTVAGAEEQCHSFQSLNEPTQVRRHHTTQHHGAMERVNNAAMRAIRPLTAACCCHSVPLCSLSVTLADALWCGSLQELGMLRHGGSEASIQLVRCIQLAERAPAPPSAESCMRVVALPLTFHSYSLAFVFPLAGFGRTTVAVW